MTKASRSTFHPVAIADFCETGSGGTPARSKASQYFGGSIPWVKSGELRESVITSTEETITDAGLRESAAKLLPTNTLLVALYGATVGRIGVLGIEAATNQAVCHVIPDEERADRRYLFYALQAQVPFWLSKRVGGGQPNISQGIIKETKIPLPYADDPARSLQEQKRIADILDKADAIRRKQQEAIEVSNTFVSALFTEMFTSKANRGGDSVRVIPLEDAVEKFIDYRGKTPTKSLSGVPLVTARVIKQGRILPPDEFIPESDYDAWMRRGLPRHGDVLFTTEAPLGEVAQVFNERIALAQRVLLMRGKKGVLNNTFLRLAIKTPFVWNQIQQRSTGSTVRGIRQKELRKVTIPVPNIDEQQQFERIARRQEESTTVLRMSLGQANDLFNSLVQRAFKGEL